MRMSLKCSFFSPVFQTFSCQLKCTQGLWNKFCKAVQKYFLPRGCVLLVWDVNKIKYLTHTVSVYLSAKQYTITVSDISRSSSEYSHFIVGMSTLLGVTKGQLFYSHFLLVIAFIFLTLRRIISSFRKGSFCRQKQDACNIKAVHDIYADKQGLQEKCY